MGKVLIIGVNGYLGRHLAAALLKHGYAVDGFDFSETPLVSGIQYEKCDLRNPELWETIDFCYDVIYFFAGITGTGTSFEHYENFLNNNELTLLHLLNRLRKTGKNSPRIVFPSSRLVYRGSSQKLDEDAPKTPLTVYAVNKLACESYLQIYHRMYGIPYTVVRIGVPYGNLTGEKYSYGTVGMMYRQIRETGRIQIFDNGEYRRTFHYISDLCEQIYLLSIHPRSTPGIFNLDGEDFSLLEVARILSSRYHVPIHFCPYPEDMKPMESGSTVFNSFKLHEILGRDVQTMSLSLFLTEMSEEKK